MIKRCTNCGGKFISDETGLCPHCKGELAVEQARMGEDIDSMTPIVDEL